MNCTPGGPAVSESRALRRCASAARQLPLWPWCLLLAIASAGCTSPMTSLTAWEPSWDLPDFDFKSFEFRAQAPGDTDEEDEDEFETTVKTPMIGEYTTVAGLNVVTLQGVGLVVGLDGTGDDPPPSMFRTALLDEMRRRGVRNPNQVLKSPGTALVVVRAYLPPLIRKGEHFDVEVRVPPGSEATSLNGGWLLETTLSEQAIVPGRGAIEGHVYARAAGPILVSTGVGGDSGALAGVLKRGRILGGGVSLKDRDLSLYLRSDFRSVRNSKRIADRIGRRFFAYNEYGLREPLADPKTDQRIVLKVQPKYRDNFPRYLEVVRNIAFRETDVAQRVRMQRLQEELNAPATALRASLRLEAIGHEAVPVLRSALNHENLEVRFYAAMALAYLGESEGLPVLAEAAKKEPAFRIYAFAAMAVVEDAEAHIVLRDLLDGESAETRYGAFRALTTLDENDPFVRGEKMNNQFMLHVLDTQGEPMVHLTRRKKSEIVLFGADQRFSTPLALRAGRNILITARPGSDEVVVARYEPGRPDLRKVVSTRIAEVIRTVADDEFGASYPDVAGLLAQAAHQKNLPGRVEIDSLPRAGRVYYRRAAGGRKKRTRVGNPRTAPNLFDPDRSEEPESNGGPQLEDDEPGEASLADIATDDEAEPPPDDESKRRKRMWYDPLGLFTRSGDDSQEGAPSSAMRDEG